MPIVRPFFGHMCCLFYFYTLSVYLPHEEYDEEDYDIVMGHCWCYSAGKEEGRRKWQDVKKRLFKQARMV